MDTLLVVFSRQLPPIGQGAAVVGRDAFERFAVRSNKAQGAVVKDLDDYIALMDLAVVEAAQLHQVRQLCFSTLCPMVDVMSVHITCV